jgi:hypothetical protein
MKTRDRVERLKVRLADSRTLEKISDGAKATSSVVAGECGFVAHCFGKLFSPVARKVRELRAEYRAKYGEDDLNSDE